MNNPRFIRISNLGSLPHRPGRWPIHINSIWRLIREGKLPKPVKLTPGCVVYQLEVIEAIEASRGFGGLTTQVNATPEVAPGASR